MENCRSAFYPWEFGWLKIGYSDTAITWLKNVSEIDGENAPSVLSDQAYAQMREYLAGERTDFDLPLDPQGTAFQQKVWAVLRDIPYGQTRTYRQIAESIGQPAACRAVGMANGKNPIWIVIPCHRVIGTNGKLTGYAGGLAMKEQLLAIEGIE